MSSVDNNLGYDRGTSDAQTSVLYDTVPDPESSDNEYPESESDSDSVMDGDNAYDPNKTVWDFNVDVNTIFQPRFTEPQPLAAEIKLRRNMKLEDATELDIFLTVFPRSLIRYIAQCTNERIVILEVETNKVIKKTNPGEICVILGIILISGYNRLPSLELYWSSKLSLGNALIVQSISRDRFRFLHSKLYFTQPNKSDNASKTYYTDDLVNCLKKTFQSVRSNTHVQSIDEAMVCFKGRSSLKQYMPLKPIKRGIKIWVRSDAQTGYCYDFNIYCGKETDVVDGSLGERVVKKLVSSIHENLQGKVAICFDRFFTSLPLLDTLPFPCTGTYIKTRKNTPNFQTYIQKHESEFAANELGTVAVHWKDTKDVFSMSNFHDNSIVKITRKQKNGDKLEVNCPKQIFFYNRHMGGVDMTDQYSSLYDSNRKSKKWWKKVFAKLLSMSVTNSWIVYKEIKNKPRLKLIDFLVPLAEQLVGEGVKQCDAPLRTPPGRKSQKKKARFSNATTGHWPIITQQRLRCQSCKLSKVETRTPILCSVCNIGICINCFTEYHTKNKL